MRESFRKGVWLFAAAVALMLVMWTVATSAARVGAVAAMAISAAWYLVMLAVLLFKGKLRNMTTDEWVRQTHKNRKANQICLAFLGTIGVVGALLAGGPWILIFAASVVGLYLVVLPTSYRIFTRWIPQADARALVSPENPTA